MGWGSCRSFPYPLPMQADLITKLPFSCGLNAPIRFVDLSVSCHTNYSSTMFFEGRSCIVYPPRAFPVGSEQGEARVTSTRWHWLLRFDFAKDVHIHLSHRGMHFEKKLHFVSNLRRINSTRLMRQHDTPDRIGGGWWWYMTPRVRHGRVMPGVTTALKETRKLDR